MYCCDFLIDHFLDYYLCLSFWPPGFNLICPLPYSVFHYCSMHPCFCREIQKKKITTLGALLGILNCQAFVSSEDLNSSQQVKKTAKGT